MPNPVPALGDQPVPEGFTRYHLPDGRKVFFPNAMPAEERDQALGAILDMSQMVQAKREPGMYEKAVGPVTQGVSNVLGGALKGAFAAPGDLQTAEDMQELGQGISKALIPQTPTELGIMAGTAAAGPAMSLAGKAIPKIGKVAGSLGMDLTPEVTKATGMLGNRSSQVAGRLAGGTMGGAIGSGMEGEGMGRGAVLGAVSTLAGEALGKTREWGRSFLTNLTDGLYKADGKKVAKAVGEAVPALGAKNAEEFRNLTISNKGMEKLFNVLEANYDRIGRELGDKTFIIPGLSKEGKRVVPILRNTPEVPGEAPRLAGSNVRQNYIPGNSEVAIDPIYGMTPSGTGSFRQSASLNITSGKPGIPEKTEVIGHRTMPNPVSEPDPVYGGGQGGVTFRETLAELRNLFKKGWGGDPTVAPSEAQINAREQFHAISGALKDALPDQLRENFTKARNEFRVGSNIITMVRKANGSENRLFKDGGFRTNVLQQHMSSKEAQLKIKLGQMEGEEGLGEDVYGMIAKEVFRGLGRVPDREGLSLGRLFATQQTPGAGGTRMIERFPIVSFPQYAGKPFATKPTHQTLIDLLTQRATIPVMDQQGMGNLPPEVKRELGR